MTSPASTGPFGPEVPFKISIPDSSLELLKQKLALVTFPDELEDSGRKYGSPLADVKRLVARWKEGYDWRQFEMAINEEMPMFTRDIEVSSGHGILNIHYVHKKSSRENAIPLLFCHGWPGSFIEVRKILPLLTASDDPSVPSFHVVVPSIPGFGFSDAPRKQAFGIERYAETLHKLMISLGYEKYVTQGGDWGHFITAEIARTYEHKHVMAWHTNTPLVRQPKLSIEPATYLMDKIVPHSEAEKKSGARSKWFFTKGKGYFEIQSTQPETLGYGLADSPVGCLAWIYEKLVNWTDDYPWKDDEVLDWISIYWFSRAGITASLRIYFEILGVIDIFGPSKKPSIPMGASFFPQDIFFQRALWLPTLTTNLAFQKVHSDGGHFSAYERPKELAEDLRKMFGKGSKAFGVVPGKNGVEKL